MNGSSGPNPLASRQYRLQPTRRAPASHQGRLYQREGPRSWYRRVFHPLLSLEGLARVRGGALKVVCLPLEPLPPPSTPPPRPMSDAMGSTTPLGTPPRRARSSRAPSASVAGPSSLDDPQRVVPSTFTTCLSIPVIGTRPIKNENKNKNTSDTAVVPAGPANPSRMSRGNTKQPSGIQSSVKPASSSRTTGTTVTDATNALEQQQQIASTFPKNGGTPEKDKDARRHPNLGIPPIHVAEKLDMNTVRTSVPRTLQPAKEQRPFEIDNVPAFYPTAEEFVDPMGYLRSIRPKAEQYGLCKIIPPETWKMPFVTNTEVRCVSFFPMRSRSSPRGVDFPLQDTYTKAQSSRGIYEG